MVERLGHCLDGGLGEIAVPVKTRATRGRTKRPRGASLSPSFAEVRTKNNQGWYFNDGSTPTGVGASKLPPILHMTAPSPIPGYSKAPRGLFVLPRVARVFTGTAISPSPPSRQWPSRSTIHAGRNLPDKGLRYLRTVRVTAAVHRGFSSQLAPLPLTFRHWAGVSLYT